MAVLVRPAGRDDVAQIHRMIVELATFEREPDAVRTTVADLDAAMFGERPQIFCHVAQDRAPQPDRSAPGGSPPDGSAPQGSAPLVGFALWYVTFSTWTGKHGIWLEDLYVRPEHRAGGVGRRLVAALARIGLARGYARIDWWVLDWNSAAHQFYRRLGARSQDDWTVWRLDDTGIAQLAATSADPAQMAESRSIGRDSPRSPWPARGKRGDDDLA